MASVGDIYRSVVTTQLLFGQEADAVFHYQVTSGGGALTAENVADEIDTNILAPLQAILSDSYLINNTYTFNMNDPDDFNITNPNRTGARNVTNMPQVLATGVRGPWPGTGFNRARKNFPLGGTIDLTSAGAWSSTYTNSFSTLLTALGSQLENSNGLIDPVTIAAGWSLGQLPVLRASARGDWEVNSFPTTMKTRQTYNWLLPS